ncbi:hypothetical protein COZ78_00030 [bacterium (Candidatus Gribaldobacteria) CG_4_8_14_3_um_filter_42_11]|uniref:RDD domain-containing protein n=2 Tax=Candidatus Gribaldobacteria TaxID=2798536 RepID=A0A2M7IZ64_9BACT|nr:MAG: hypothetical protein COZ78_00030 [bacterium (Candidatus Gribaldobacteria) CG_4_8_14_3_um_filter_42_11]
MSAKKTICFCLTLFIVGVLLAPVTALAINHIYTGCAVKYTTDNKKTGGIDKTTGACQTVAPAGPLKVCYEGMVPCGKNVMVAKSISDTDNKAVQWNKDNKACEGGRPAIVNCQLCHFFVMIDGLMDFLLVDIVPPITVAMLVIGGVMFYFRGFKQGLQKSAIDLFKSVVVGLFLIYGAYMLVGIFLMVIGSATINPIKDVFDSSNGVFSIICPVEVPLN